MYPVHGKTPGAGGAGGGYCAITKYIPLNVVKCIWAEVINAFKNSSELLFGGTSMGDQVPGFITIACVVAMEANAPIGGMIGGNGNNVAPAQYVSIAGPIICNKFGLLLRCVCCRSEVSMDCIPEAFVVATGTLLIVSPPNRIVVSYANVNELANDCMLFPYA